MTNCARPPYTATVVLRAAGWNYTSNLIKLVLGLATTMFYARNVVPEEFGLLALAQVSIRLTEVLADFGLGNSIVQRKTLSDGDVHTALLLSIITALGLGAMLALLAPRIAAELGEKRLGMLLRLMAASTVITASSTVFRGLLRREMRFGMLALIETSTQTLSHVLLGIPMVLLGFGVWGMVWAGIGSAVITLVSLLLVCRHHLGFRFSWRSAKGLYSYGSRITISSFLQASGHISQPLLMAKALGTGSVGLFTTSQRLVSLPIEGVTTALRSALFPVFSASQTTDELRSRFLKSYFIISSVILLWCGFAFATADALIFLVLGEKWIPAVPIVKILSLGYAFGYMSSILGTLIDSSLNLNRKLIVDAGYLSMLVVSILLLYRQGMLAVIGAYSALEALRWLLYGVWSLPSLGLSGSSWFARHLELWPIVASYSATVLCLQHLQTLGPVSRILTLSTGVLAGLAGMGGIILVQLGWRGVLRLTRAIWGSPFDAAQLLFDSLRHTALREA